MSNLIDFDAFRAEQEGEPIQLKIGGVVYDLPTSMPAAVALDLIRLRKDLGEDEDVPPEALEKLATSIFGSVLLREILDRNRLTLPEMAELLQRVFEAYNPGDPLPNRKTRREKTGASSSR